MVNTDRIADMWTDASDDYDRIVSRELHNPRDVDHWRHGLAMRLGDEPRDVLDVGCGPGFFSIMLSRLGHRVTSLDASEGMLRAARHNLTWYGIEPHVQHSDVVTLDGVADSSVDAVVSRDVVWTLHDPAAAYRRWFQVLRPGGLVLVYDGNYRTDRTGVRHSIWQALSNGLIMLTEGRRSGHARDDGSDPTANLPSRHRERPATDVPLLRKAGFMGVTTEPDRYRMSRRHLGYWKYAHQGEKFIIEAHKPSQ